MPVITVWARNAHVRSTVHSSIAQVKDIPGIESHLADTYVTSAFGEEK